MVMLADIGVQDALTLGGIVVGAVIVFWILQKIVKFILSLVIVLLIVAAAVAYCVKAGYISSEDAEKLNPLRSEQVRQAVKEAGSWAGTQVQDAAKKAVSAAVDEAVGRGAPTDRRRDELP